MKKRILVDLDGVIHSYTSGWQGKTVISDPPNEGAIDWLNYMSDRPDFEIIIWTSRVQGEESAAAKRAIRNWLRKWNCQVADEIIITMEKLPALMMIDDRGYRFMGHFPSTDYLNNFKPWSPK